LILENEKLGVGAFSVVYKGILKKFPDIHLGRGLIWALEMKDGAMIDVAVKMPPPHASVDQRLTHTHNDCEWG
jgi:hypothetical protein